MRQSSFQVIELKGLFSECSISSSIVRTKTDIVSNQSSNEAASESVNEDLCCEVSENVGGERILIYEQ